MLPHLIYFPNEMLISLWLVNKVTFNLKDVCTMFEKSIYRQCYVRNDKLKYCAFIVISHDCFSITLSLLLVQYLLLLGQSWHLHFDYYILL